jgi:DNA-binding transcriptional LysR family regulator
MIDRDVLEADALVSFAVFADRRNFTTAAVALHISQPSLHTKIRKLAEALGTPLYERDGRRLVLTPAGQRLAVYAHDNARRLDDFLDELRDGPGTVTIAAGRGSVRWVIADAVRHAIAGGRRLALMLADREAALTALAAGRADLAVIGSDPPPPHLSSVLISTYPQVLALPASHALASRSELTLADLDALPLVVPPPGRPLRRLLERALLDADARLDIAAEVDGWELLVHFVSLGLGAAVVNGCVGLPAGMVALPISDLPKVRYWAVWRPQRGHLVAGLLHELQRAMP